MITNTLKDGSDHISLSVVDRDIEKHSSGLRVLEGAAVPVEPRGKDNTVCSRRNFADLCGKIIVEAQIFAFRIRYHLLIQIYAYLVQRKMILYPFKAFSGSFEFCIIIEITVFCGQYASYHGVYIDSLVIHKS